MQGFDDLKIAVLFFFFLNSHWDGEIRGSGLWVPIFCVSFGFNLIIQMAIDVLYGFENQDGGIIGRHMTCVRFFMGFCPFLSVWLCLFEKSVLDFLGSNGA